MNLESALMAADKQFAMLRNIGETNRMQQSVAHYVHTGGDLEQLGKLCSQYGADRVHNYIDLLLEVL